MQPSDADLCLKDTKAYDDHVNEKKFFASRRCIGSHPGMRVHWFVRHVIPCLKP